MIALACDLNWEVGVLVACLLPIVLFIILGMRCKNGGSSGR